MTSHPPRTPIPAGVKAQGLIFIVRTSSGRVFPYVPSFGVNITDVKSRMRDAVARGAGRGNAIQPIALARCTIDTTEVIQEFDNTRDWRTCVLESGLSG